MKEVSSNDLLEQNFSRRQFLKAMRAVTFIPFVGSGTSQLVPAEAPSSNEESSEPNLFEEYSEIIRYQEKEVLRFSKPNTAETASGTQSCSAEVIFPVSRPAQNVELARPLQQRSNGVFLPYAGVAGPACYPNEYGAGIMTEVNSSINPVRSGSELDFYRVNSTSSTEVFPIFTKIDFETLNSKRNPDSSAPLELLLACHTTQEVNTLEDVKTEYGLTDEQARRVLPLGIGAENPLSWRGVQDTSLAEALDKVNLRRALEEGKGPIQLALPVNARMYQVPLYSSVSRSVGELCSFEQSTWIVDVNTPPAITIGPLGQVEAFIPITPNELTNCDNLFTWKYVSVGRAVASIRYSNITDQILDELIGMRYELPEVSAQTAHIPQGSSVPVFDERAVTTVVVAGAGIALGFAAMGEAAGSGTIYLMR